ncbi:MAG: hypothetical protein MRJ92_05570 [Nitrospira sp.]|nr:hypothetical protein [Nitrospira sp.]
MEQKPDRANYTNHPLLTPPRHAQNPGAMPTQAQGTAVQSFQRVYEDLLAQGVEHATAEARLRELRETLVEQGMLHRHSSLQLLRMVLLDR